MRANIKNSLALVSAAIILMSNVASACDGHGNLLPSYDHFRKWGSEQSSIQAEHDLHFKGRSVTSYSSLPSSARVGINEQTIRAYWKFVSDPLLAGRLVGTDGERIAAKFIAARLAEAGVQPSGQNGTYFQTVPLKAVTPVTTGDITVSNGTASETIAWTTEYIGATQRYTSPYVVLDSTDDVVFAGYGIVDANKSWDDYRNIDVYGKIVIVILGQPSTGVWAGADAVYGARWERKAAVASAKGAKAIFCIAASEGGYAYSSIIAQHGGVSIQNPDEFSSTPLALYAWISTSAADKIAHLAGTTWDAWHAAAKLSGFAPSIVDVTMTLSSEYSFADVMGTNVVGVIPGNKKPHDAVVVSGHLDHLGVLNGNTYNGARDNAAGVAATLTIATAIANSNRHPDKSIVFFFPTAEEHGLYGSKYFVAHLPGNITTVSANVNFDIPNTWGTAYNIMVIGKSWSNVGTQIAPWACAAEGITSFGDDSTTTTVFRSDHYSFLTKNIPAVWTGFPTNFTAAYPYAYCKMATYMGSTTLCGSLCYHMPCDKYSDDIPLGGLVQNTAVNARIAWAVADTKWFVPTMLKYTN